MTALTAAQVAVAPAALTVLLVDKQPLFCAALEKLLATSPIAANCVCVARSDDALAELRAHPFAVVLCELNATPLNGPDFVAAAAAIDPSVRVILLGEGDEEQLWLNALHCGAAGFFTKDARSDEFMQALDSVLAGQRGLAGARMRDVVIGVAKQVRRSDHVALNGLSNTELEILALLGRAESIDEIARIRGIGKKTVRNHISRIYSKLGIRSRAEAVRCAIRHGLVEQTTS